MLQDFMPEKSRRWFLGAATWLGVGFVNGRASPAIAAGESGAEVQPPALTGSRPEQHVEARQAWSEPEAREAAAAVVRSLSHVLAEGVDDVFPKPFEIERLRHNRRLREEVGSLAGGFITRAMTGAKLERPIHRMITPKAAVHGYRSCAHIEVVEYIRFLACALLVAKVLEPIRIPASANRVFSFRFIPEGVSLFDRRYGYESFQAQVLSRLEPRLSTFVVTADIVDFFPNVNIARLMETLRRFGVHAWLVDVMSDQLQDWNRDSGKGLPTGSNASRILAEAALLDVDLKLQKDGIDFVRFVDDYRFCAPDAATARRWLARLIEHLAAEGLTLNHGKTSIAALSRAEYQDLINSQQATSMWGGKAPEMKRRSVQVDPQPKNKGEQKKSSPKSGNGTNQKGNQQEPQQPQPQPEPEPEPDSPYERRAPSRRSQLNERDRALLKRIDPAELLPSLKSSALTNVPVLLGDFRLVVEASLVREEFVHFFDIFEMLEHCPHCIPYLVDVLVTANEEFSVRIKRRARKWFATRLASGACLTDYEVVHVARLLGAAGYEDPEAVYSYFLSTGHARSPIAARALLSAMHEGCNEVRAVSLLTVCDQIDAFTRRAVLNLIWPHLGHERKSAASTVYRDEFVRDPFLSSLVEVS